MNYFGAYKDCPFDKSHRIIDGRLQKHLFKCRQNYPKNTKVTCPFDAIHILDPQEYEYHLSVCSSSGNVRCYEHLLEPQVEVGTISLENACSLQSNILDEDWSGNNPTYDPLMASENKNVMRTVVGLSKSKKKQFKKRERERVAAFENHNDCSNIKNKINIKPKQPEFETPLRVPKKAAKAICNLKSDATTNGICFNDLISKLKEVSIEKNKENGLSKKESQQSILNNTFNEKKNCSIILKDVSQCKDKKNALQDEMNTSIIRQDTVKIEDESKKIEIQKNDSNKTLNNDEPFHLSPKMAATFYGQAKKISTGRGFTIACENLRSKIKKERDESINKTLEDFRAAYGYDEDENDDDNSDLQKKSR